jgi:hypothetical protein
MIRNLDWIENDFRIWILQFIFSFSLRNCVSCCRMFLSKLFKDGWVCCRKKGKQERWWIWNGVSFGVCHRRRRTLVTGCFFFARVHYSAYSSPVRDVWTKGLRAREPSSRRCLSRLFIYKPDDLFFYHLDFSRHERGNHLLLPRAACKTVSPRGKARNTRGWMGMDFWGGDYLLAPGMSWYESFDHQPCRLSTRGCPVGTKWNANNDSCQYSSGFASRFTCCCPFEPFNSRLLLLPQQLKRINIHTKKENLKCEVCGNMLPLAFS